MGASVRNGDYGGRDGDEGDDPGQRRDQDEWTDSQATTHAMPNDQERGLGEERTVAAERVPDRAGREDGDQHGPTDIRQPN